MARGDSFGGQSGAQHRLGERKDRGGSALQDPSGDQQGQALGEGGEYGASEGESQQGEQDRPRAVPVGPPG
ncbi:hypothetical protein ACWC9U_31610 [Streptomyces sp. 900116325]